ncbi:MAG: putative exporters of the RND superfamily, partial [halophilic archaeon J07HB67]
MGAAVSLFERLVGQVTAHSRIAIVVMLVLTAGIGVGATEVSQESSLNQFQTDSAEADKLDYIDGNFSGDQNTTTAQVIVRESDGNVLDGESLRAQLAVQRAFRDNETVEESLSGDAPTTGIANVVATAALQRDAAADVRATATEVQTLNQSVRQRQAALEANRTELEERQAALTADRRALENRTAELNATAERLRGGLTTLRESPNASVQTTFDEVNDDTAVALNETDLGIYTEAATRLRNAPNESVAQSAFELGTQGVLREEFAAADRRGTELQERGERLRERGETLERRGEELEADADRLESLANELETERAELENASEATLDEQRAKLASMNESEIDET